MRVFFWLALVGCKTGSDTDFEADCSRCEQAELCIAHVDEAGLVETYARCVALPSECGLALACDDNTCVLDAYGLCDVGYVGGLCSSDEPPALTCYAEDP